MGASIGSELTFEKQKVSTPETATTSYRSPSPEETFTPQARSSVAPSSKSEKSIEESKSIATTARENVAAAAAAVSSASPMSYDEMKAELEKVQAKLTALSQDGGLRLRKVAAGETSNATVNEVAKQIQQQEGVPLQIVAGLCLLCFLIAYFFF
jgi:hypothetical protein